jgi:hypothetical protein
MEVKIRMAPKRIIIKIKIAQKENHRIIKK